MTYMTRAAIEPGLLRLFRWFVGIRLGVLVFLQLAGQERAEGDPLFVPQPGIFVLSLLLIYLFATPLQERLGKWYLPLALWTAAIGPLVENAITVQARLAEGSSANDAIADYWLLFFYLFVPLILVAWQYRFRWVLLFAIGTFFLDASLTMSQLESIGADITLLGALMLGRASLLAFTGLIIVKLVGALRTQREALAQSSINRERLAMSEERRRLARELHDTLAHTLSAVAVQLEGVDSLWDEDPDKARSMLGRSLESARSGLTEARRSINALRSSSVEELGLTSALVELCRSVSESSPVTATLEIDSVAKLSTEAEHTAYRIAREALTNTVRHAGATKATVRLSDQGDRILLTVSDNGRGFDPAAAVDAERHGVRGMNERAALIGSRLDIRPNDGGGTVVEVALEQSA
jgi:signal transduction histidine kinase